MKIGSFDTDKQVFIIAEIGNNHEGSYTLAEELIGRAVEAGADAVKFQTFIPEFYVSSNDIVRLERLRCFQLSFSEFERLAVQAKKTGLVFFSTPFDIASAKFLNGIQSVFKIASGDNTFYPLIDTVAGFGKPMIVSTGLVDLSMVEHIHDRIRRIWSKDRVAPGFALLHCVASYPVPLEQANLGAIAALKARFPNAVIGYSDHTLGIEAAICAVAGGARILEKHFTLDKQYSNFRDHQLSADPADFRRLVDAIRLTEEMFGTGEKVAQPCEKEMGIFVRRSIAISRDLPAGTNLMMDDLTWVRPGTGIPPGNENFIVGHRLIRTIKQGELITLGDID